MEKPEKMISERHKTVIDAYFNNGFNKVKAGLTVTDNYNNASVLANTILKDERNSAYIQSKRDELMSTTKVNASAIVRELLNLAFSDITDFISLSDEEIKELPSSITRCIHSVKTKTTSYKNRDGKIVTEKTHEIKLHDKIKPLDMLSKYVGLFSEDNKQKQPVINLNQFNTDVLNVLLDVANKTIKQGG